MGLRPFSPLIEIKRNDIQMMAVVQWNLEWKGRCDVATWPMAPSVDPMSNSINPNFQFPMADSRWRMADRRGREGRGGGRLIQIPAGIGLKKTMEVS